MPKKSANESATIDPQLRYEEAVAELEGHNGIRQTFSRGHFGGIQTWR
jgi:hypothetical protein